MTNENHSSDDLPKQSALHMACECGGDLGLLVLPSEEPAFVAICPGCGTNYRREIAELTRSSRNGEVVTVLLPRSRPRG